MPLQLTDLEYKCQGEGAWLALRLCMSVDGSFSELEFDSLRLHLAGDHYISQGLYLGLLRHLAESARSSWIMMACRSAPAMTNP